MLERAYRKENPGSSLSKARRVGVLSTAMRRVVNSPPNSARIRRFGAGLADSHSLSTGATCQTEVLGTAGFLVLSVLFALSSCSCRLALERPRWSPAIHSDFPPRFKAVVQLLLMVSSCSRSSQSTGGQSVGGQSAISAEEAALVGRGACRHMDAGSDNGVADSQQPCTWTLSADVLLEVCERMAYPISAWVSVSESN
jgi:hypothetical protein